MQKLTKAQEDLMHLVWQQDECTVGDLRDLIEQRDGKKPAHSTISTLMKALDDRGFVTHREYGRTWVYTPAITREEYGRKSLGQLIKNFFGGSAAVAVSQLAKSENLSLEDLNALVQKLEEE